ncbi:hypothetical protein BKA67DRAFT_654102 [Truncatella angustata]|uniref:Uncharacterized protein n=1 Tax=Truncatella angustata TaxID=152316 RepID=A0A9P8UZQ2_9PEZI|nr:uncharacterized protein BKA67DRAFT_654102 [Truncatella angustata]KAH6660951.1 hypothetical protein BKA67DRAFT_654102 [Truncatella angustata]KAH8194902.1 hypothetical protein TruAng_010925 [Truncatella angustata]
MTRKLPWRDGTSAKTSRMPPARDSATPTVRKRANAEIMNSDAGSKDSASPRASEPKVQGSLLKRCRLDSKPLEPLEESFMVEGLDGDDVYRMVEDEFYLTATKFTAHLHAAEYQRLQEEAKLQNAATIRNISRPVVGRMTDLVKKKQQRVSRLQRQKTVLNGFAGVVDGDDAAGTNPTTLFGLMESPRKKIPRLDHFVYGDAKSASKGRLAHQSSMRSSHLGSSPTHQRTSHNTMARNIQKSTHLESDDEDLDGPGQRSSPIPFRKHAITNSSRPTAHSKAYKAPEPAETTRQTPSTATNARPSSLVMQQVKTAVQSSDDDSDEALFGFQKRAKSRAQQKRVTPKNNNENRSRPIQDFIPGFL